MLWNWFLPKFCLILFSIFLQNSLHYLIYSTALKAQGIKTLKPKFILIFKKNILYRKENRMRLHKNGERCFYKNHIKHINSLREKTQSFLQQNQMVFTLTLVFVLNDTF